jgi:hypothetical protein
VVQPQPQPEPPRAATAVIASLRVTSPGSLSLDAGDSAHVSIAATMSDGTAANAPNVRWTAGDRAVATVSPNGTVFALGEGRTTITAAAGSASARVSVVVRRGGPASISIAPHASSLKVADAMSLLARVRDRRGTALSAQVSWRSSNPAVATVDIAGNVRAIRPGEVTVIATTGSIADSTRLTVVAPVVAVTPEPQPTPPPSRTTEPAASRAPSDADMNAALSEAARTIGDGFVRGQVGIVTATSQFSKLVRDARPNVSGTPQVEQRTFANGRIEGDVALPLHWTTFTGGVKDGAVRLHIVLEQHDGAWRAASARNLTNP